MDENRNAIATAHAETKVVSFALLDAQTANGTRITQNTPNQIFCRRSIFMPSAYQTCQHLYN